MWFLLTCGGAGFTGSTMLFGRTVTPTTGLPAVLDNFRPKELWTGAEVRLLPPSTEYQPGPDAHNNDSLVLEIRFGQRFCSSWG